MNTEERACALARVLRNFPIMGRISQADLLEVVRLELGHPEILDGFRPYGSGTARAIAASPILHIVSGNTPHAALQSLTRGLLLGAGNLLKIPSTGLPEVDSFIGSLPSPLSELVEVSTTLQDSWLQNARAVVVFGSDETIASIRAQVSAGIPFQAHGHRVSLSVVFDDPDYCSVAAAALDVSLYNQHGCLSPHDIYVDESSGLSARSYAARLAETMDEFNRQNPRGPIAIGESAAIADLRASYTFRAAADIRTQIWCSNGSTDWTVIYEEDPWFATSPLNRVVFVKPLPPDPDSAFGPVLPWLGAIGIHPATGENADRLAGLGASRICPFGRMQFPPFTWHAEGHPNLTGLVRLVDFEPNP